MAPACGPPRASGGRVRHGAGGFPGTGQRWNPAASAPLTWSSQVHWCPWPRPHVVVPVALRHDTACVLPALNASIQKLWRQDPCAGQSTVSLHGPRPGPGLPQPSANPVASPGPATLCPSIRPTDPSLWHHLASTHLCDSHQGMTATALAPPPQHETCHSQPQEWPWCHAHPVHLSALQCSLAPLRPC